MKATPWLRLALDFLLNSLVVLLTFGFLNSHADAQTCAASSCWTGNFYQYQIVAYTDESVQVGSTSGVLTGFGVAPSINENGAVAFVGQVSVSGNPYGQTLFFENAGSASLTAAAPNYLYSRTFNDSVQINDSNQIVAQDSTSVSPGLSYLRVWDGNVPGQVTNVAVGGGSSDAFKSVLEYAAINSTNQVAFTGLVGSQDNSVLVASDPPYGPPYPHQVSLNDPLRPLIADSGSVVVRAGNTNTSPIKLYSSLLETPVTIADSSEFSALGQSPGISRDGVVVVFAGNLKAKGRWDPDAAGPGIFAAILESGAIKYRTRVAGFHTSIEGGKKIEQDASGMLYEGTPWCDPGEVCAIGGELEDLPPASLPTPLYFSTFTPSGFPQSTEWEQRISVVHQKFGFPAIDTMVVSFLATPDTDDSLGLGLFNANSGLWTVRVDWFGTVAPPFYTHVYRPVPVLQVGDTLGTTGATVSALGIFDPLQSMAPSPAQVGNHWLGFWVCTDAGGCSEGGTQMILRASYIQQYAQSGINTGNDVTKCSSCGSGTLGALVNDVSGNSYILSNDHILGNPLCISESKGLCMKTEEGAPQGDPISVPGQADYSCALGKEAATFYGAVPLESGVDAAIAALLPGQMNTTGQIYNIGIPANVTVTPTIGAQVAKQGKSSSLTCGAITATNFSRGFQYESCNNGAKQEFGIRFNDLVVIESNDPANFPFDLRGDSGSIVVTATADPEKRWEPAQPTALIVASGDLNGTNVSYSFPISAVLSDLGVRLAGGGTHPIPGCHFSSAPAVLSESEVERARLVKEKYVNLLMQDPAVIGVGVSAADHDPRKGVVLVVVEKENQHGPIPPTLDDVPTKIVFGGRPAALQIGGGKCSEKVPDVSPGSHSLATAATVK